MRAPGERREVPGAGRLRWSLLLFLGLDAALAWVVVLGIHTFLQRVWLSLAHRGLEVGALERHWAQVETARCLHGLVWLAAAMLFLAWVHRAWARLRQAGVPGLRFTPRAAVGAFLIPVLNLAGGYRAVAGLWDIGERDEGGDRAAAPGIVKWWWGLFVVATALDPPLFRLVAGAAPRMALGWPTLRLVVAMLVEIAAAALAIGVVWRADAWHAEWLDRRGPA